VAKSLSYRITKEKRVKSDGSKLVHGDDGSGLATGAPGSNGLRGHSHKLGPAQPGGGEMQMKLTMTAIGIALISVAVAAAPASAQPEKIQDRQKQDLLDAEQPEKSGQIKLSRQAAKAIQELQETVKANNFAEVPAKAAAADAVARTVDDRYIIGVFRYQAATAAKDDAARAAGLEAMIASQFKGVPRKELYLDLGSTYTRLKQADRAAAAYQQALQLDPNSIDATAGLAELRIEQGQTGEALALLQKGIALQSSGGAQPTEAWLKRAVAVAYNAKLRRQCRSAVTG
jgi:tetratricopeptide (TPR) repeat protein